MFSSIQEVIVLLIIVFFIFFSPNFFWRKNNFIVPKIYPKTPIRLKYKIRLFILASLIWLSFFIILIKPWEKEKLLSYIVWGTCPVALFWGVYWVNSGNK